jgi:EmrB/QacA subfamily drug resistance transporter
VVPFQGIAPMWEASPSRDIRPMNRHLSHDRHPVSPAGERPEVVVPVATSAAPLPGRGRATSRAMPSRDEAAERRSWWILALMGMAQFMVILDVTVVNVALPSIGNALGFAAADLPWVITVYVLFTGGLMLLGGRATDLLGRRRVFGVGLLVFTVASLASGLAWSPAALIGARAVQGLGAALLLPSALAVITTTYTGAQRTVALTVWGAIGSAGVAAGVLLGGVITTLFGWEWIFLINVPVGFAIAAGTQRLVPATRPQPGVGARLDLIGAAVVMAGLVTLVYAVAGTAQYDWMSGRTLLLLAVASAFLAAFAMVERRGRQPLVPPATWRIRSLVASAAVMLGATAILVGAFFLNTVYLQNVLGYSALQTGLSFLPLALTIFAAAHLASHLLPRVGSRVVVLVGLTLITGAALLLVAAPDQASYAIDLLPAFLLLGAGVGLVFVAISVTSMADVEHVEAGLASGMMTTAHELGAAFGVAILSSVAAASSDPVSGYSNGLLSAAVIAVLLALVAAFALPSFRPAPGTRASIH